MKKVRKEKKVEKAQKKMIQKERIEKKS